MHLSSSIEATKIPKFTMYTTSQIEAPFQVPVQNKNKKERKMETTRLFVNERAMRNPMIPIISHNQKSIM